MALFSKFTGVLAAAVIAIGFAGSAKAALVTQLGVLDLAANGGINPETGLAWAHGDTYRLAFVTGATTLATSTDIADYNNFVQGVANSSTTFTNLGSVNWLAIGSTSAVDAKTNTLTDPVADDATDSSVILLDGKTVFANDYTDMWDGTALPNNKRIERTENNILRQGNLPNTPIWANWTAVWTGTTGDGTASSPLGGASVRLGLMKAEPQFWISRSTNNPTQNLLPMYAISEVLTVTDDSIVIPEPASLAMGLAGLALVLARRKS